MPPGAAPAAVLVVDDDAIVREWLQRALGGIEFRVAGEAATAANARDLVVRRHFDAVLVDQLLPDAPGTDLVRALRRDGFEGAVVVMTAHAHPGLNELAREAGAASCLMKSADAAETRASLREALGGGGRFDIRHPARHGTALSPRERDVVRIVATGATNREVARQLGVGPETVKTLLSRTYRKLGVGNRMEAVASARTQGLL